MRAWEIHPASVHFPIAFLIGGVVLDLFGQSSEAALATATYLLITGLATGVIAAGAGVIAYYTVPGNHTAAAHHRVYWHIWTVVVSVVLFTVVCLVRWQHPSVVSPLIRGLGIVAMVILALGAYIGGDLVYHGGLGIDPVILKPGLRSTADTNNSPPASPVGAAMTDPLGQPAER